jgi:SAM-dependent methyltransferase
MLRRNKMKRITEWLDKTFYPNLSYNWSDIAFRNIILDRLSPEVQILDLGAGAGIIPEANFKDLAHVCGLDPDPRVVNNPYLHEAKIGFGDVIPYSDGQFDVVIANNVLEHLEDPLKVFREVSRVLRPGGYFIAKTPNRHHYVPLIARLTPTAFHRFYGTLIGRGKEDTFPTVYRANSSHQLQELAKLAGMQVKAITLIESRPEYLRINPATYLLGIVYERLVNCSPIFANCRVVLIAQLQSAN